MELIILPILILFAAALIMLSVRIVRERTIGILETFGKFSRTMSPGIHFIVPFMQSVAGHVNLRIHEIRANIEVKTKDNTFVKLPVAIQMMANPENAEDAYYKLTDPNEQITSWILNSVRSIASGMTLAQLYEDKDEVVKQVTAVLNTKLQSYGYFLETVLIDQPTVEESLQHSFNRVVAAKREAEAAKEEGEALRVKAVAHATAEAESQRLRAQGMADARLILAKGLAESVHQLESENLEPDYVVGTLLEINRLDVIREASGKGNTILFDMARETGNRELMGLNAHQKNKAGHE